MSIVFIDTKRVGMIRNFFDILEDILMKHSGKTLHQDDLFQKNMSVYMITRYLSMRDSLLPYARIINRLSSNMTGEQVYLWAYDNIPKQRSPFIKYISKKKKK